MIFEENCILSNGVKIPRLALGTWLIDNDKVADAVSEAIKIGYRHIDTAQAYENEQGVGEGVRKSGIKRSEIFITSKVAAEIKDYTQAAASIDLSLQKMGLDYIDLMIIHCPQPWEYYNKSENRWYEGNREVWAALEDALSKGKVKAIGVSNFLQTDIENILSVCKVKPMVNQIECHISCTPAGLISYCNKNDIAVEAYCPMGHGDLIKNSKVCEMAERYGVTPAQLCIRYDWQLGTIVLPKTTSPERMRSNSELDFEISGEDMKLLMEM